MKKKEIKPVLSKITRGVKRVKKKAKAHGMGSITEGETCSAFGGKCCTVKQGVLKLQCRSNIYLISFNLSLWITCKISLWLMGVLGYFSKT